ncbi:MAG: hypothetical protein A3B82_05405 [Methylophilales bacterium RIFCSPHIGHO2_02_FULL_57_10]|nr:MAG: hypothetical protein A3B82_05405 [Methylophilales bacterium RIFCSPHIGHO2_02_FULL_57_10]
MQGARRSEWLFHSQGLQRRRRSFVFKPFGLAMLCAQGVVTHHLFGMTKRHGSRLALRAQHGQRTFVSY